MWGLAEVRVLAPAAEGCAATVAPPLPLAELLAHSRKLALFLDFDGTLAEGPPTPSRERRPAARVVDALERLQAAGCLAAIVTGRSDANLLHVLPSAAGFTVASSHGLCIRAGSGATNPAGVAMVVGAEDLPAVACAHAFAAAELVSRGLAAAGVGLNDEAFFFSFQVSGAGVVALRPQVLALANDSVATAAAGGFGAVALHVHELKGVVEVRPPSAASWDKGHATTHLLRELGLAGRADVCAVAVGDDASDEAMFRAVLAAGCGAAAAVRVGLAPPAWASAATHCVRDHEDVGELLVQLADAHAPATAAAGGPSLGTRTNGPVV